MIRFVCILFSLMAFCSPWFVGGNYPFVRTALVGSSGLILWVVFVVLVRARSGQHPCSIRLPVVWWLLLAGVAFTAFQAMPQSAWLQTSIGYQPELMGHDTAKGLAPQRSISVYAPSTRKKLIDLVYGVGLFVAASLVMSDLRRGWPIFASLTTVGVLIGFVGVLQILSGEDKILWQYELLWGGSPFSSFVNSNNAAGFLLICLSASFFFLTQMILSLGERAETTSTVGGLLVDRKHSSVGRLIGSISILQPRHLYILAAIVAITAGVMMTGSRSGVLALFATILAAGLLLSRANRFAAVSLTLVLISGSVAAVVYSEQAQRVSGQMQTLTDLSQAAAPRLQHWKEALPFGLAKAALGTGNGTYRYISPVFQKEFTAKTFAHAENVFLETLVEMGAVGVLLLLFCIAYCGYAAISLYRRSGVEDQALGVVGISCLGGQLFISMLDFGIYQPANTTAMALVMAAVVGRHCATGGDGTNHKIGSRLSHWVKVGVTLLLALASCWAAYESFGVESKRLAKRSIKLLNIYGSQGPSETRKISLEVARMRLEVAERMRPDDTEVQFLFGELEICQYRLLKTRELKAEVKEQIEGLEKLKLSAADREKQLEQLEAIDAETIWRLTAMPILHQQVRAQQNQNPELVSKLLDNPNIKFHLCRAMERFRRADALCPLLTRPQIRMAQLAAITQTAENSQEDTFEQEQRHIGEALSRSVPKTQTLFSCGLLALNSGNQDMAVELWRECLEQPHLISHERVIVELCLHMVPMKRLYEDIFPQNPKFLLRMAGRYLRNPEMKLPKKFLVVHIKRLIETDEDLNDLEKNVFLARAARHVEDYPAMVENYSDALVLAPLQAPSRYDYAFALYKTKQFDEAVRQLKVCELDPSFPKNRTKQLLKRIRNVRSIPR